MGKASPSQWSGDVIMQGVDFVKNVYKCQVRGWGWQGDDIKLERLVRMLQKELLLH